MAFSFRIVPRWLIRGWSMRSPELRSLLQVLRRQNASLEWVGTLSWPNRLWKHALRPELAQCVVREVLLEDTSHQQHRLLPSEEAMVARLVRQISLWKEQGCHWRIVLAGDPAWSSEEMVNWKRALSKVYARWLWRIWVVDAWLECVAVWLVRRHRRAVFGIDNRLRIR